MKKISFINQIYSVENISQLVEAICCNTLKYLTIHIEFTPELLLVLIRAVCNFGNLKYFCVNIIENHAEYKFTIKQIISLIKDKRTMISKVKIHKYVWDIENLKGKDILEIIECGLNPLDLMILAELCRKKILKNIKSLNLSENLGIVNDYFTKYMAKLILASGCNHVVIKNSGCTYLHETEILEFLGHRSSSLSFII